MYKRQSDQSQTLKLSKVDFVTDGWTDWAGSGPSVLPVGGVRITADVPLSPGTYSINRPDRSAFCYEMDQLRSELRMTTATAPQVKMTTWLSMDENLLTTELTNLQLLLETDDGCTFLHPIVQLVL